jgi:SNF2 family DNA or RNA helicase
LFTLVSDHKYANPEDHSTHLFFPHQHVIISCAVMTTVSASTYPASRKDDDPWLWDIDDVIAALCLDDGPLRGSGNQRLFPEPHFLAQTLKENAISGPSLLTDLDHAALRDELGIKALGHRTSILHCIQDLRRQSPKYLDHVQKNTASVLPFVDVGARYSHTVTSGSTPFTRSSHQGLEVEKFSTYSKAYGSPDFNFDNRVPASPSAPFVGLRGDVHRVEDTVNMVDKENIDDPGISKSTCNSEPDGIGFQPNSTSNPTNDVDISVAKAVADVRLAETCIIDERGRKRRRLDLSKQALKHTMGPLLDTVQPTGQTRPDPIASQVDILDDVSSHLTRSFESSTTPLAEPQKSLGYEAVTVDKYGRKRLKPVHVTRIDDGPERAMSVARSPETFSIMQQPSTTSPTGPTSTSKEWQRQMRGLRKPHHVYLGLKSSPIDTIFYGDTILGQEVKNDVKIGDFWLSLDSEGAKSESFMFTHQPFGNGIRRYVGARIRHFLSTNCPRIYKQEKHVIIIPYPERLIKKHHQLSATVLLNSPAGIIVSRMDRSKCLQNTSRIGYTDNDAETPHLTIPQVETSSMDWSFLQKWTRQGVEDRTLPVYGDSGSEGEYDVQTWKEMEEERRSVGANLGRPRKRSLSSAEIMETLDVTEKQMVEQWKASKQPKLLRKACSLWRKSSKDSMRRPQIENFRRSVKHLDDRLVKIRTEIKGTPWTSIKQVRQQCRSMEASIFDREKYLWFIEVLNNKAPPSIGSKVASKNTSRGKTSSLVSDSEMNDFIVEDDNLSAEEISAVASYNATEEGDHARLTTDSELNRIPQTPNVGTASEDAGSVPRAKSSVSRKTQPGPLVSKDRLNNQPHLIDLTQQSDSLGEETSPVKYESSDIAPRLPSYYGDPFQPARKKPFKRPPVALPVASSVIVIDSDPTEASCEDDLDLTKPDEVKNILKLEPEVLVSCKDRRALLVWTIGQASMQWRNSIWKMVQNSSLKELRSTILTGLKVIERNKAMKLPGLDERDSASRLLLAAWYVCWTIPVAVDKRGIEQKDLRTTMANEAGFPDFFEFLKRALAFYENFSVDHSMKPKRRKRLLAVQEDQPDHLLSSPHKKRKYAVPESDRTRSLRANALLRVQERNKRQELLKRRLIEMGVNDEDASKVIVNPGKLDHQSFIYMNPKIADRMQPHQIEGVRFMWREVIADHQGCLLAQTMGLGKTMQVITLLVTIAEAAKSHDLSIREQVPEDLRNSRTLILCPPALIENWWDEFLMWTPLPFTDNIGELRKVTATLKVSERLWEIQTWKEEGGVLLLGFHTFRDFVQNNVKATGRTMLDNEQHKMVIDALLTLPNIIVADEAHVAKTAGSAINVTLNRVKSMTRIALTGSPLANNLDEYHSLIDWIAPGYLGSPLEFRANYVEKIQAGLWQDSTTAEYRDSLKRLEALKQELAPKVHRADITALQGRLKEKQEFVVRVPLTPLQEEIYHVYVETMGTLIKDPSKHQSSTTVWAWLSTLRLLCNHPKCFRDRLLVGRSQDVGPNIIPSRKKKSMITSISTDNEATTADEVDALVDAPVSEIGISQMMLDKQLAPFETMTVPLESVSLSNKMQVLMDILLFSKEAGDKVLIFSHSIYTLNYVETQLKNAHTKYSRIDGDVLTGSRQQITKDFNNNDTEVCLISTRAGGQGLNLFGANRVVILDDHFNPMYEEQAVGRAYRIGQLKPVFVYHLMAGGTFEEQLHNQSVFKQQLAKRVVDKKNPARRALRGIGEYLLPPRKVDQKDLKHFEGKDTLVLDRILASQNE